MWQSWVRWKMQLCKWHTFWMVQCLICCFIVIFILYWEKVTSYDEKLSHNITLKVQIVWKISAFQCPRWKYRSKYWKIVEFQKNSVKMKNSKTFYMAQTASCFKSYYVFGTKIFLRRYTEMYRHLFSKCFKNAVLGRQEMVQCNFFSDIKQKYVCWEICKVFDCVAGAYYFQCQMSWSS